MAIELKIFLVQWLWQRFLETKNGKKYKEYAQARNKVKGLIRALIRNKNKKIALDARIKPKRFWAHVNKCTKVKNATPELVVDTDLLLGQSILTTCDSEKAEVLS